LSLSSFLSKLDALFAAAPERIEATASLDEWTEVRNQLIGRQAGELSAIIDTLSDLPKDERKTAGQRANQIKAELEKTLETRRETLQAKAAAGGPKLDLTMPARDRWQGTVHPVSLVIDEVVHFGVVARPRACSMV
jgi:phenylalanyl-tRNA synthetase alpha chain